MVRVWCSTSQRLLKATLMVKTCTVVETDSYYVLSHKLASSYFTKTLNLPTFADKGFSVHGPKAWNKLPDDVREINNQLQ